jgi:hypothetical protein
MLNEWLAAQNRVADRLKISRTELDKIQSELRFKSVLDFIRHGKKREAVRLLSENFGGAKSGGEIIKTLFRLSVPQKLFQWNRQRKRRSAVETYGKLKI